MSCATFEIDRADAVLVGLLLLPREYGWLMSWHIGFDIISILVEGLLDVVGNVRELVPRTCMRLLLLSTPLQQHEGHHRLVHRRQHGHRLPTNR